MQIEATNLEVVIATHAAQQMGAIKGVPATMSFRLAILTKALSAVVEEVAKREEVLKKQYAKLDEEGNFVPRIGNDGKPIENSISFEEDKRKQYEEEMKNLHELRVEVPVTPFRVADFLWVLEERKVDLPSNLIVALGPFVSYDEPPAKG